MDVLQDFLTTVIVFLEYLFLGYIAFAFVVYSFEQQAAETSKPTVSKRLPQSSTKEPSPAQSSAPAFRMHGLMPS